MRVCIVDEDFFPDDKVLTELQRGYREACERSLCLRSIAAVALPSNGTMLALLPLQHFKTLGVYQGGFQLEPFFGRTAHIGLLPGYFEAPPNLGISPAPVGGSAYMLYARTPTLPGLDEDLDPAFPAEFHYLLWHYIRWRWITLAGGAGRISQARWERQKYDEGIRKLRIYSRRVDQSRRHGFSVNVPRRVVPLHPSTDAR